jgi:predicted nucleotidyltransferase component of viral defense system
MNSAVEIMLQRYHGDDRVSRERALREIIQEIVLVGLWRTSFFHHAAFYGGTALRILYGLDRFSENLDFTLLKPNANFHWQPFERPIIEELAGYGFEVSLIEQEKKVITPIRSAFLKANTFQELIKIGVGKHNLIGFHPDTILRIKIEIDTSPSVNYAVEERMLKVPLNGYVSVVTLQHLFAAKLHCAFFRVWKNRVKGRDWYDVVWFIRNKVPLSLELFSRHLGEERTLSKLEFLTLTDERMSLLRIDDAKRDVAPFIYDRSLVERWSPTFFREIFQDITYE